MFSATLSNSVSQLRCKITMNIFTMQIFSQKICTFFITPHSTPLTHRHLAPVAKYASQPPSAPSPLPYTLIIYKGTITYREHPSTVKAPFHESKPRTPPRRPVRSSARNHASPYPSQKSTHTTTPAPYYQAHATQTHGKPSYSPPESSAGNHSDPKYYSTP